VASGTSSGTEVAVASGLALAVSPGAIGRPIVTPKMTWGLDCRSSLPVAVIHRHVTPFEVGQARDKCGHKVSALPAS
jgi:hypothetical protein